MRDTRTQQLIIYISIVVASICLLIGIKEIGQGYVSIPTYLAIAGACATTFRYSKRENINLAQQLLPTIKNDYTFKKNIGREILSLLYAISQGGFLGSSLGFFIEWLHALLTQQVFQPETYLWLCMASLALIFLSRICLEISSNLYQIFAARQEHLRKNK